MTAPVHSLPRELPQEAASLETRAEARLTGLRADLAEGERALADLDRRRDQLSATLLRISGAITVIEEILGRTPGEPPTPGGAEV